MDGIEHLLTRGVDKIYPSREALEKMLRNGKKLKLYQGFDPTGPNLHIGHAVALRKLRQFQNLGHHVIFLIGDFTGMVGDPSGKYSERKQLTREQVLENAKTYKEQASKILRFDGENPVEIKYNSEWLAKMSAIELLQLSHHLTAAQVMERDMFQKRMAQGQDVFMNEFLYPFMQGYDSVAMNVDLEIGGSDQMFNMLMGRKLMRNILHKEKFVMTVPLLTDAQGVKIGKTEDNVIGIADPPNDFFGKVMALGDDAIIPCFTLLTDIPLEEIENTKNQMKTGKLNPMKVKLDLALELTKQFNSKNEAYQAKQEFIDVFINKKQPVMHIPKVMASKGFFINILLTTDLVKSKSEAKRLMRQGAVEYNGKVMTNEKEIINPKDGDIIRVGKSRFTQLKLV